MKKIKVLHISETFAAGVYTYIKDICNFFEGVPHVESYVIYSGLRKDTDRQKFKTDFSPNTHLTEILMTREIHLSRDFVSVKKMITEIKRIKPDIIHLHSSKAGVLGRIASFFYRRAKVYYTPNGYSFLRQDVPSLKKKIFYFIEKFVPFVFGGITIACGDTEFHHAKKLGPAILVRNGLDIESLQSHVRPSNNKRITLGTIGRLSPQKNPSLFNDIALHLPELNFIWIGDGELRDQINASNVSITGWMPRERVLDRINDFDIYIQTSLWEGLPFTIIEAMALGKPVVATNVVGNKDAVEDGYNGYLCMETDTFVNRLKQLTSNPELRRDMGQKSKDRAFERFNRNSNFLRLKEIYTATD